MAISHQLVSLTSEGAVIVSPAGQHAGRDLTVQNVSSANVFLGGEDVNPMSYGFLLAPNTAWSVELRAGEHLYAWGDNATVAVLACGLED